MNGAHLAASARANVPFPDAAGPSTAIVIASAAPARSHRLSDCRGRGQPAVPALSDSRALNTSLNKRWQPTQHENEKSHENAN